MTSAHDPVVRSRATLYQIAALAALLLPAVLAACGGDGSGSGGGAGY